MRGLLTAVNTREDEGSLTSAFPHRSAAEELARPAYPSDPRPASPLTDQTDARSVRLCKQTFPGGGDGGPLAPRSKRRCACLARSGSHVFMCAQCNAVFFNYVYGPPQKKDSWDKRNSIGVTVSPPSLCGRHFSSTPLAGLLPADHKPWNLVNTWVAAPIFPFFPPALFPTLPSCFPRSSALGFPHLQHSRVFTLQRYSPESFVN